MSKINSTILLPESPIADFERESLIPPAHKEAFYRTTLLSIGDAVIATNTKCVITFMNPVAETLTGWTCDEGWGEPFSDIFQITSDMNNLLLESPAAKAMRLGHAVCLPKNTLLITRAGKKTPLDDSSAPILDEAGNIIGAVVIFRDISLRKRGEETLRKSDKLATAGLLAATIAHEINNPLAAVTNLLFIVQGDKGLSESTRHNLELMDRELSRVTLIANQALGLHRHSVEARAVDLCELLDELLVLYRGRLQTKKIRVEKDFQSTTLVEGFEGDINQVFSNLIANAIDAMGETGVLSLHVHDAGDAKIPMVEVDLGDTGGGISPDVLERVFEPFYTTKETGAGLGLWVVKEIVDEHGGSIRIQSGKDYPHPGTCFSVCLPLTMNERPSVRMSARSPEPPLHNGRRH